MMTINYGGQNLSVLFKNDPNVLRLGKHGFEDVEQLSCAIVGDDNIPKAVGSAVRSEQDDPNDLVGMELALGRALQRLTTNKAVRAQFWSAFYKAVNTELATTQPAVAAQTNSLPAPGEFVQSYLSAQTVSYDLETPTLVGNYAPPGQGKVIPFESAVDRDVRLSEIAYMEKAIEIHNLPSCATCQNFQVKLTQLKAVA